MPKKKIIITKFRLRRKNYTDIKRFEPDAGIGLNNSQVITRIAEKKNNTTANPKTKSLWQIFRDSTFTLFNLINVVLACALIYVGSHKNMLFMGVVISNIFINLIQELRAKRATDKLSLLSAATATVVRNGSKSEIKSEDVVLDDILIYSPGKQIITDSIILEGECEVNESFLTGESEPAFKEKGDMLYSGSFISSGSCVAQADAVGKDNAAYEITAGAKNVKTRDSEIVRSLRKIIRVVSVLIIPLGVFFFYDQLNSLGISVQNATEKTVAAMIGMIPEGLILLTSTVMAVIVVKLSRRNVLVNELYSIEMLARTDVICLDKTGTLTEGSLTVKDIVFFNENNRQEAIKALSLITASLDKNETMKAVENYLTDLGDNIVNKDNTIKSKIPFSSKLKWCGITSAEGDSYIFGAPEMVISEQDEELIATANRYAADYRVLCLCRTDSLNEDIESINNRTPVCFILMNDKIRVNVNETIRYFSNQGVTVKVISGDNPVTVSGIAKKAGIDGYEKAFDMSKIEDDSQIEDIADKYVIFGRTTPIQKQLLIKALRKAGHTVAMTGDGVNDVLAMKEADCSIAVAQGTDAARTVADIVLLDSSFESVPKIVEEGRMSVNNLQRTASFFIVKTIYSTLLTLTFLITSYGYPFIPIQLTLISAISIGIPSFALAFEINKDRVEKGFIQNILLKAFPTGFTVFAGIVAANITADKLNLGSAEASTISVIIAGSVSLLGVLFISMPLNTYRLALISVLSVFFALGVLMFRPLFDITALSHNAIIALIITAASCAFLFLVLKLVFKKIILMRKTGVKGINI